jgi:TetR/AcrR family transcriptional repressor of mexJK operon
VPSYYRWLSGGRTVRTAAPEAVRETILRAARTAFLRDGFGACLERVAAVAGVSRQTVYNLFGTKERLFGEVVQSVYRRMIAPALVVDRGADLSTMLAICGRHLLALMLDPEAVGLMRIALGEYREHPQLAAFAYAVRTSPIVPNVTEVIGRRLEAEMAAGAIDGVYALLAAKTFVGSFTAHARHRALIGRDPPSDEDLERRLRFAIDLFVRGLGYPKPQSAT